MNVPRRTFLHLAAGAAALPVLPRLGYAETYPDKPIRLVVAVPPGGTFDIVGRLIAQWLSKSLGQQVVVENRPGAATNVGTGFVAHSAPDGYTLLIAGPPSAINETLYPHLDFDFKRDIAPVASIEHIPLIMAVNPKFTAKTVAEFISHAKANPGRINMGSGGVGSAGHVTGELFAMMADIKITHVPYHGEAPALTDLIRGQVEVVFSTAASAISYVRAGTLRALAVTSAERMDALPNVPVAADFLPGYEATAWSGICAPARTPVDIIDMINRATNAALADPKLKAKLANFGAMPMAGSPADFKKFIAGEITKWAKVIKFAHIPTR
jgi:tripartite-type tricarboxylate transporter receptor subunit TctC